MGDTDDPSERSRRVPPWLERLAAYGWRLIVIGVVVVAGLWLARRLWPVLVPIVIAFYLSRILAPLFGWLRRHRWRSGLASLATILVFFSALAGLSALIGPSLADEAGSLGPTVTQAFDDMEDWLVNEAPFDIQRETIDRLREQAGARVDDLLQLEGDQVVESATFAAEVLAALILAVLLTFFMLRDGVRFAWWVHGHLRPNQQEPARRAARRAWITLGGYLRGAAILGVIESILIGVALFASGGGLVGPVMILTFLAAFVPIVGAIVAGVVAVLVGLVTGGLITAIVVAIVALAVQQLDNDLLGPIIYGRALDLHPVVVLLSVVGGGALFGIAGTLLAVPVVAVAVNVAVELRSARADQGGAPTATGDDSGQ